MTTMTPAQIAASDQHDAKEREFDRKVANIALVFLWLFFSLGVYTFLGLRGDVPLPPWAPGVVRHEPDNPVRLPPSQPPAPSQDATEV